MRRLDDRIRALSAALASKPEHDVEKLLSEFYAAVHEYTRRLENRTTATVLAWPDYPLERRSSNQYDPVPPVAPLSPNVEPKISGD